MPPSARRRANHQVRDGKVRAPDRRGPELIGNERTRGGSPTMVVPARRRERSSAGGGEEGERLCLCCPTGCMREWTERSRRTTILSGAPYFPKIEVLIQRPL